MRRMLIVANQTLASPDLLALLEQRVREGPCAFHVLVPATAPQDQWMSTEGEGIAIARERLDDALERLGGLGAQELSGEVGDERPLDAIRDAMRETAYDEIVLSTLPTGVSRWLRMDLPSRVERTFDVPVTHIPAPEQSVAGA